MSRLFFIDNGPACTITVESGRTNLQTPRFLGKLDADSFEWFFLPNGEYWHGFTSRELLKIRQVISRLNRIGNGYSASFTHKVLPNGTIVEREDEDGLALEI